MHFIENDIKHSQLYIGVNAGQRISNKIDSATKSIKIVSPYFGGDQIIQLQKKLDQNVDIHIISTDGNKDFRNPKESLILKNIIKQTKLAHKKNKILFNRLKSVRTIYTILYFSSLSILLFLQLNKINSFLLQYKYYIGLLVLVIPIITKYYQSIEVFKYKYETTIPIYFIKNPMSDNEAKQAHNKFIHSKIYIIDDEIAFVGSINFTYSGFFGNYETCVTIEDKETIFKLSNFFNELYKNDWLKIDIDELGKKIYDEPIN